MSTQIVTLQSNSPRQARSDLAPPDLELARSRAIDWLTVLESTFRHPSFLIEVRDENAECLGHLPLCLVRSRLFGRYLVSLPYLNTAGVCSPHQAVATMLIDRAVELANELRVQHLELRHETPIESQHFNSVMDEKVHMRLDLPDQSGTLWQQLKPKVRNQVRKGETHDLRIEWGRNERHLRDFYRVFSHNMRDLGTPVYSRMLFANILKQFQNAEVGVTYLHDMPIAAAYLHHEGSDGVTCVPSASCLRRYNPFNANMWMYWQLLCRAIERRALVFDFGRSTVGEGTFRFKKQWGAEPINATWQYYRRSGEINDARPNNPKYERLIQAWQKLPLWIANSLGPRIVRGIP